MTFSFDINISIGHTFLSQIYFTCKSGRKITSKWTQIQQNNQTISLQYSTNVHLYAVAIHKFVIKCYFNTKTSLKRL